MGWQPTTRLHVSGYRFLLRRIECALLGRDIRAVNESMRAPMQSLLAGAVLAIIMLAGCAVLAMVRPQPAPSNAPIVMGKQSGALYVRIGETLHPVLNLASARLITRTNADPQPVPESELSLSKRGLLLGIPGAPTFLGQPLGEDELRWTVCDSGGTTPSTTVVIGPAEGSQSHPLASAQSVLVRPVSGGSTYLLYAGRRAVVNLDEPAVVRALELDGRIPSAVSPTLLNAIPEAPPIAPPRIPNRSARGPAALAGFPVGSVLRVTRADGDEYYVVLSHGIQRIGRVAADLLRFSDSHGARTVVSVAPDVIRATPTVTDLPVATFPDRTPTLLDAGSTTLCVGWQHVASGGVEVALSAGGLPIPVGQEPVKLSQADGNGPAVDAVYLSPGRSAYVRATALSGDNPQAGTRYLITDIGVRFAVQDDDAAHDLGLPNTTVAAPWPVLAQLPAGPELSREKASVAS
ncbi:MAG: type VII secretion protein EccB [Mycobacterium sp.]|uniref:type VII secretion protein EccB n=1 Tax=Mycobacterium sp. TaxID=1785 RepID=UPI003C508C30